MKEESLPDLVRRLKLILYCMGRLSPNEAIRQAKAEIDKASKITH